MARKGPALTLVASCEGCAHLRIEEKVSSPMLIVSYVYHCGEPTMLKVHPFGVKPKKIGRKPATPAWCPLLAAAKEQHARAVLAKEGEA